MIHGNRRTFLTGAACSLMAGFLSPRAVAAEVIRVDRDELRTIVDPSAPLDTLFTGGRWLEGPCYSPASGGFVFSDVRENRMWLLRDDGSTQPFRVPSENANGNSLDAKGRLVTCEHRTRQVVRLEADGSKTVLADRYDGKRLNSPNDATLAPDGAIWFTDPTYGITKADEGIVAEREQTANRVYRIDPSGRVDAMTDALAQPNGIAISPDGRTLYVSETGGGRNPAVTNGIVSFSIGEDQRLASPRVLVPYSDGVPDGLALDIDGRLYAASADGVRIFDADGRSLGVIRTPKTAANLAFGGPSGRRLIITATDTVHGIDLMVRGLERSAS